MDTQKANLELGSGGFPARFDDEIRDDILDRLSADRDVDITNIEIQVDCGHVTLEGTIPEEAGRERAGDVARDTPDVIEVINQLRVELLDNGLPMSDTFV